MVSTVFRALTNRKVTVPGTYRSHHGANALKCSMKANEGYLYPLEKSFLFIPKPTTFIPHSEIGVVSFSRLGTTSGGSSRTFDIKFHMKNGSDIQFSSINREEYANLEEFLRSKRIKVKSVNNEETIVAMQNWMRTKMKMKKNTVDARNDEQKRKWMLMMKKKALMRILHLMKVVVKLQKSLILKQHPRMNPSRKRDPKDV